MVTGLGMNNCIPVKADEKTGKMLPSELEKAVKESKAKGGVPFLVNCTTGTTVFGAFDPINDIADICKRHNLWLHLDVSLRQLSTTQSGKLDKLQRENWLEFELGRLGWIFDHEQEIPQAEIRWL